MSVVLIGFALWLESLRQPAAPVPPPPPTVRIPVVGPPRNVRPWTPVTTRVEPPAIDPAECGPPDKK